jgi:uncharacterized membrane protein YphA (DoxX/SURF4 family)
MAAFSRCTSDGRDCWEGKVFFFEKKKQKTFAHWRQTDRGKPVAYRINPKQELKMTTLSAEMPSSSRTWLNVGLWAAQALLALAFCLFGFMKLTTPLPELAKTLKSVAQLPELYVRALGLIDILGGIGVLLPAITRIQPRLTVLAALGCVALQVCAIIFHASRGEFGVLPLNFILISLAAFILWGRARMVPIAPR